MITIFLLLLAIVLALIHISVKRGWHGVYPALIFLRYLLFFCVGLMGLLAFYAHIFMSDAIAAKIGWEQGSPFQLEIGMANLSYGVLGILTPFFKRQFSLAVVLGYSILLLGAFIVHLSEFQKGDVAPYNIGIFVWVNDLLIPILLLVLTAISFSSTKTLKNS